MPDPSHSDARLRRAFQIIALLLALVIFLAGALLLGRRHSSGGAGLNLAVFHPASVSGNMVREWYPGVDFRPMYPGYTDDQIDLIQRQTFDIRFIYAPWVQFRGLPVKREYIETSRWGYRKNAGPLHPWPPESTAFNVFVFGGSTTFGSGLPDTETVVAHLERELSRRLTNQLVRCYNFGAGYYFSTQERILFHDLLLQGIAPRMAIFIDGLNDFRQVEGFPEFTPSLHEAMAPDIPFTGYLELTTEAEKKQAVEWVLQRYLRNTRLAASAAVQLDIRTVFVGQPVPFFRYPVTPRTYPFTQPNDDHKLCAFGYPRFGRLAAEGSFGPDFIWAADAFESATESMYADAIHYSPAGARRLARVIAERIFRQGR